MNPPAWSENNIIGKPAAGFAAPLVNSAGAGMNFPYWFVAITGMLVTSQSVNKIPSR